MGFSTERQEGGREDRVPANRHGESLLADDGAYEGSQVHGCHWRKGSFDYSRSRKMQPKKKKKELLYHFSLTVV